ncbi:MAG TPA: hypothetical protein VNT75_16200 [Symbiobacteriaceae bacterium]|nr:hypothetical protein [Symbiobacteriaceae bacterium]
MSEERLRTIMRDGLESLPLPSRFLESPTVLATARKPHRRYGWFVAATAACLAVTLIATPLGARVVRAVATRFVTEMKVENTPLKTEMPEWMKQLEALKPGDTLEVPQNGSALRQVYRAVTFEEAKGTWPLPTYRAPDPQTTVLILTATAQHIALQSLQLNYVVPLDGTNHKVFYTYSLLPEEHLQGVPEMTLVGSEPALREKVLVKGHEAIAVSTDGGKSWHMAWSTASGQASIQAGLPLQELVKIVESIPNL